MNFEERMNLQKRVHKLEGLLVYAEQTHDEPVAAPLVAQSVPREPAAPVTQPGAKGRKLTFVQTEFWE